ncbi:hypothetical protein K6T82_08325 [Flavobacterium sp. 17A]|uniref:Zinc-ribbon 15 domain-containing protein n=1 Tax=Flavobacterium potami TaxID=2872310 RepID=A0A9X1H8Q2_9FLAO|nr:hypothetical protein [Flavobacterium potami]MBZ4034769.1 hypothetical protein [Flavobacterium potami]
MLLLIGTKDSNVKNGFISNEKCPNCKIDNTLNFSIFRRYVSITSIPLFPVGKIVDIQCTSCKNWFYYEDLSLEGQEKLKNEKLDSSLWMFSGTFILFLLLIYGINQYFQDENETDVLIQKPIVGDVYNVKFSNGYYSTFKIDKITNDSIYATHNDFDAYLPYEVDDLDKTENYTDRKVSYSKKELIRLYQNDEIIKIRRNAYSVETQKSEYKIPVTK